MNLTEELWLKYPHHFDCSVEDAATVVNEALERAAQECEKHSEDVDANHWRYACRLNAKQIRALKSPRLDAK